MTKREKWKTEDLHWLIDNYATATPEDMETKLGRTWHSIKLKAFKMQLNRRKIEIDQASLVSDYTSGKLSIPQLAEKHNIGISSIYRELSLAGVVRNNGTLAKVDIVEFSKDWAAMPTPQMKVKYGVTSPTLWEKARELKLPRPAHLIYKQGKLTEEQQQEVLNGYLGGKTQKELAEEYAVSKSVIHHVVNTKNHVTLTPDEAHRRRCEGMQAKYGVDYGYQMQNKYGKTQQAIGDWLKEVSGKEFKADRTILQGKEIDLYNDELRMGIEYCGLYWHTEDSPEPRTKWYHHQKSNRCREYKIRLITIFEDEWLNREKQVKSFLKSMLGANSRKFQARKCEVCSITKEVGNKFIEQYHIQGKTGHGMYYAGLYDGKELLAVMSFGRHPRQTNVVVLDRLCFKEDCSVAGGSSRLFKFLVDMHKVTSIVSWSDNRWSEGRVYSQLGFIKAEELDPDYSYVDFSTFNRVSKQSQKKGSVNCPENMTELEFANSRGLHRIWDCGKIRWEWTKPK